MKHTPGPWGWQFFGPHLALVGKHSDRPIILDVTPKGVMRLRVGHVMRPITMVSECEENADLRLVTAAPDLLAACKEAYFAWAHGVGSVTTSDDPDTRANADRNLLEGVRIMRVIEAAIHKAEGGAK